MTVDFRRCTLDDFAYNEYEGAPPLALEKILCPATEAIEDYYKVKNSYSNVTERSSFNLEIITCNSEVHPDCASDDEIIEFVEYIILT